MPTSQVVRARIVKIINEHPIITQRSLLNQIGQSYRSQVESELSKLLSIGWLNRIGLGTRGSPVKFIKGMSWPADRCPYCLQEIVSPIPDDSTEVLPAN